METAGGGGGKLQSLGRERSNRGAEGKAEIPAQRLSAEQHSPGREACLLTRQDRRGLGAEAPASVRLQEEDWG